LTFFIASFLAEGGGRMAISQEWRFHRPVVLATAIIMLLLYSSAGSVKTPAVTKPDNGQQAAVASYLAEAARHQQAAGEREARNDISGALKENIEAQKCLQDALGYLGPGSRELSFRIMAAIDGLVRFEQHLRKMTGPTVPASNRVRVDRAREAILHCRATLVRINNDLICAGKLYEAERELSKLEARLTTIEKDLPEIEDALAREISNAIACVNLMQARLNDHRGLILNKARYQKL
jgi:hypothetical protein